MVDVAHGALERQGLDFRRAESREATPVMICFHGGGFRKGDKRQIRRDIQMEDYLAKGISSISANYALLDRTDVPNILKEYEKVLTFVLSKVGEWNPDPQRIGVSGYSASALIAYWVGVHHPEDVSVVGATMQPLGTEMLVPLMDRSTPPSTIYLSGAPGAKPPARPPLRGEDPGMLGEEPGQVRRLWLGRECLRPAPRRIGQVLSHDGLLPSHMGYEVTSVAPRQ